MEKVYTSTSVTLAEQSLRLLNIAQPAIQEIAQPWLSQGLAGPLAGPWIQPGVKWLSQMFKHSAMPSHWLSQSLLWLSQLSTWLGQFRFG
jgi:hypothetical protein